MHDTLSAWRGLGLAVSSLSERNHSFAIRFRLLLAFVFLSSVAILNVSTPSVISIGSFNATLQANASGSVALGRIRELFTLPDFNLEVVYPMGSLGYLWRQRTIHAFGLPSGVNRRYGGLVRNSIRHTQGRVDIIAFYIQLWMMEF